MADRFSHLRTRVAILAVIVLGLGVTSAVASTAALAKKSPPFVTVSNTETNFDLQACSSTPCPSHHTVTVTCPTAHPILISGGVKSAGVDQGGGYASGGDILVHDTYADTGNPYGQTYWVDLMSINGATHVNATVIAICARVD
jgi:hypothetical protein